MTRAAHSPPAPGPFRLTQVATLCVAMAAGGALAGFGTACRSAETSPVGNNRDIVDESTQRHFTDLTDDVVADFDRALMAYRSQLSRRDANESDIGAARNRVRTLAQAYKNAMVEALQRGNRVQRRISAAVLGFVPDPSDAATVAKVLLNAIPYRAGQPVARTDEALGMAFYGLIGLSELGRSGLLYVYPDRDELLTPIAALVRDEMSAIREAAVEAFGFALSPQDDPRWITTLTVPLAEERDPAVRKLIVDALANVGDTQGLQAILSFALEDPNPFVREDSIVALGASLDPAYVEPLIGKLNDPEARVRMQAIAMLKGYRRYPDRVPDLVEAISRMLTDRDGNVRERAILALGALGDTSVVFDLIGKLGDRRERVRLAAIIALGRLRDERAIPPLIQAMSDKEEQVRNAARRSLVLIAAVDLGNTPRAWQDWNDAGRPPVTGRTDPRFAAAWDEMNSTDDAGPDGLGGANSTPAARPDGDRPARMNPPPPVPANEPASPRNEPTPANEATGPAGPGGDE